MRRITGWLVFLLKVDYIVPGDQEAKLNTRKVVVDPIGVIEFCCGYALHNSPNLKGTRTLLSQQYFLVKSDVHDTLYHVHCAGTFFSKEI